MIKMTIKSTYFEFTLREAIDLANVLKTGLEREVLGDPSIAVSIPATREHYGTVDPAGGKDRSVTHTLTQGEVAQQHQMGDLCTNCKNFAMIRTGTCLTCQVCGYNTGCA